MYKDESKLLIHFLPTLKLDSDKNEWLASLDIYYNDNENKKVIEKSSGTFEIINNELIYYRTKIIKQADNLEIPNSSTFVIKHQKLILKDNYLNNYEKDITLKSGDDL